MKGAILGFVLISSLIAVSDVKGEGNYMKLCGRDFVRAVVFTCGGSRWRRYLTDDPQDLSGKSVDLCAVGSLLSSYAQVLLNSARGGVTWLKTTGYLVKLQQICCTQNSSTEKV
uniref:Insulin-like domain-containing protein n=1 Tax=Pelusios castaneus TaxID=367368 RepID=A0A8C8R810_9SAUR